MSIFDHIFLFSFLFIFFIVWGKYNYYIRNNQKYWLSALIPILFYSLIVGFRYDWGADYLHYKQIYENSFIEPNDQIGFRWLNQGLFMLGFNYVGAYIVYSLIFVICAFVLIHNYGIVSKYMYAFLLPASLMFTSAIIRQGIAISFMFLMIYFLNKKSWIGVVTSVLIGASVHFAVLIPIAVIIIGFYFISKQPLTWKITIPLYIFFALIFDVSKVGILSNYVMLLSLGNNFDSYLDNADRWFGADAANDIYSQSIFALSLSSVAFISIIYLGYYAIKLRPNKQITYLYNAMVIGIIINRMVFNFEILRRLAIPLEMLYFIVLGYTLFIFTGKRKVIISKLNNNNNFVYPLKISTYMISVITIYLLLYWGRFIFLNPNAMFFWNK